MNQMAKSLSLKTIIIPRNKSSSSSIIGKYQCKKHPKHHQSPGVCSLCLSEKLSKVSLANNNSFSRASINKARAKAYYYSSTSSSATSYESSYESSSNASPLQSAARHRRIVSDVYNTNAYKENGGFLFLSKSKSMAHVENESDKLIRSSDDNNMLKKKKEKKNINGVSKIWANLLRLGRLRGNENKCVDIENIHNKTTLITT